MTRLAELRRAAECCRDVVAHAREGIAAAGPGFILVVADDEVGADVDRQVRGWHFEVIPPGRENSLNSGDGGRRSPELPAQLSHVGLRQPLLIVVTIELVSRPAASKSGDEKRAAVAGGSKCETGRCQSSKMVGRRPH